MSHSPESIHRSTTNPDPDTPTTLSAYEARDVELSVAVHEGKKKLTGESGENHTTEANNLVKSLIFGGLN